MYETAGDDGYYGEGWCIGWFISIIDVHATVIIVVDGDIHIVLLLMVTTAATGGSGDNGKTCPNLRRLAFAWCIVFLQNEARQIIAREDGKRELLRFLIECGG
jgi:hypothetical protein